MICIRAASPQCAFSRIRRSTLKKTLILSGLMALPLVSPVLAANPSFDCGKADHDIEQLICKDDELAALDKQLAEVYRTAYQNFPAEERNMLKAFQRGWVKGRNDCWKADDPRGCAKAAYETRITELQIHGGNLVVPEPVQYQCDGGEYDYLTAVFYQKTAIPSVVLTRGDDQVTAFLAPSGSGAKYEGQNVEFWEHHGEAAGTWKGKPFKCTVLKGKGSDFSVRR
jgi:uncharacterized protein